MGKYNLKVLLLLSLGHCMTDIYQSALPAALPFRPQTSCSPRADVLRVAKERLKPSDLAIVAAGNPAVVKRKVSSDEREYFLEWARNYRGYSKGIQI